MRYGLADARNYDSVELTRSLDWFAPLYEPGGRLADEPADDHLGGRDPGPRPAPRGRRRRRRRPRPRRPTGPSAGSNGSARSGSPGSTPRRWSRADGEGTADVRDRRQRPGRRLDRLCASDDGVDRPRRRSTPAGVPRSTGGRPKSSPTGDVPGGAVSAPGRTGCACVYDPPEVRAAVAASLAALAAAVFALTGFRPFRSTRIPVLGLGRTRAAGLESGRDLPGIPDRLITEGRDADGPLHV